MLKSSISKYRLSPYSLLRNAAFASRRVVAENALISGIADVDGTLNYVKRINHTLYHKFERSGLHIGPIVHGPPARILPVELDVHCLAFALGKNGSNCIYVYDHETGIYGSRQNRTWFQNGLAEVFDVCKVQRNEVVTIAGLGKIGPLMNDSIIRQRLSDACRFTHLQNIDLALIECDDASFDDDMEGIVEAVASMEKLVKEGMILGYGVIASVRPYTRHTPPPTDAKEEREGVLMLPLALEQSLSIDGSMCEIVAYHISPTINTPATYPMLEPMFDV